MTPHEHLMRLYDASHGTALSALTPPPLSEHRDDRLVFWERLWRQAGFATPQPTGSSRVMGLVLAQSIAPGTADEPLLALLSVLDGVSIGVPLDCFIHNLWIPAKCADGRFDAAFDFTAGAVPAGCSSGQACLILKFVRQPERYSADAIARLRAASQGLGEGLYAWTAAEVFGTG